MQARGRVSIGEHVAERVDPHSPINPCRPPFARPSLTQRRQLRRGAMAEWKSFVVRQFARNGEPLTATS